MNHSNSPALAGLNEGDTVVVVRFLIDSEANIRALERYAPP